VSRLVASELAVRALLALAQRPDGLRTVEIADILGAPFSSVERAVDVLLDDDLAERRDRRVVAASTPRACEAVRFAMALVVPHEAIAAVARANPAVEFAGIDDDGVLLVTRRFAEPADEVRLERALADLRSLQGGPTVEVLAKSDLREQLLDDLGPRHRALGMRILAGSVDRSFPDRTRHGDESAAALGRFHDGVAVPSQRRLRALARRHHLRRVVAFGSATRADFRPDSDVDLLVEPAPGRRLGLRERVALAADAEALFGRDVDLLAAGEAPPALAERIEREGVVVIGPAA
jgi:uncharacterized protein